MTTSPLASDLVQQKEIDARATGLIAWTISKDGYFTALTPVESMRAKGFGRFVKSDALLSTTDEAVNVASLTAAFVAQVDAQTALGALIRAGAISFGLNEATRYASLDPIAAQKIEEGETKPISQLSFTLAGSNVPIKVIAQVALTSEALRSLDPRTQAGITQLLVSATALASDSELISALTTAAGSPTSATTPGELLAAISEGRPARPVILGDYAGLLAYDAGTLRDLQALGVPVIVCAAAAGKVFAVDAAGLLFADGGAEVATARHAMIDLGGSPTTVRSMFQENLVAVRAERFLRSGFRAGAVAYATVGA